jgi:hypothetical protein
LSVLDELIGFGQAVLAADEARVETAHTRAAADAVTLR